MSIDGYEQRRAEAHRHHHNSARLAFAYAKFETRGQGSLEFEDKADFELTFTEEPYVTFGFEIDLDEWAEVLGMDVDDAAIPPLPVVSGFVTHWDRDRNDLWVGAWCAVSVYFPPGDIVVPPEALPRIQHHVTFSAIAMKDVDPEVTD